MNHPVQSPLNPTLLLLVLAFCCLGCQPLFSQPTTKPKPPHLNRLEVVTMLLQESGNFPSPSLRETENMIGDSPIVPILVEVLRVVRRHFLENQIIQFLHDQTEQTHGYDINAWFGWIWTKKIKPDADYAGIKSLLYRRIDTKFAKYFSNKSKNLVRLDEVRWGGVLQDGIPPLRAPKMVAAKMATYLGDTDVVFGIQGQRRSESLPQTHLGLA